MVGYNNLSQNLLSTEQSKYQLNQSVDLVDIWFNTNALLIQAQLK
jgi:hypothetical protein